MIKALSSKSTLLRASLFLVAGVLLGSFQTSGATASLQGGGAERPSTPRPKTSSKTAPRKVSPRSSRKHVPATDVPETPAATDSNVNAANDSSSKPAAGNTSTPTSQIAVNPNVIEAVDGESSLEPLKGQNGTVLIFLSVQCPIDFGYVDRIERLVEDYRPRGINIVGISSNATETIDSIKQSTHRFSFVILKDSGNKIADKFGARVTPEAFLLDATGNLFYHGRIDNSRAEGSVEVRDLRDAIEATLAGRSVPKAEAQAFGCTIKRLP
jgi:peroxiredoxin